MSYLRLGVLALGCAAAYWGCGQTSEKSEENNPTKPEGMSPPTFKSKTLQLESPCGIDSNFIYLGKANESNRFTGACTNTFGGQVFEWNPANKMWTSSLTPRKGTPPVQVTQLRSGAIITDVLNIAEQSPAVAGLLIYNQGLQSGIDSLPPVPLPEVNIAQLESFGSEIAVTSTGVSLRSLPNYASGRYRLQYPNGMVTVAVNGKESAYMATSGLHDIGNKTDRMPSYLPGGLFEYHPESNSFDFHPIVIRDSMSGKYKQYFNPTSLGVTPDGMIVVAISGAIQHSLKGKSVSSSAVGIFDPKAKQFINIFESPAERPHAIGFNGKVAITPDGSKAIFPTADSSNTLVIVDLRNGSFSDVILPVTAARSFFSDIQIIGDQKSGFYATATNIHNEKELFRVNLQSGEYEKLANLADNPDDKEMIGANLIVGNSLFVSKGSRLYRLDRSE